MKDTLTKIKSGSIIVLASIGVLAIISTVLRIRKATKIREVGEETEQPDSEN